MSLAVAEKSCGWRVPVMVNREEIETAATLSAMRILRIAKVPINGWMALLEAEIYFENDAERKVVSEDKLTALLHMARSDLFAYQAICTFAAEQVALGEPVSLAIRQFAADVLSEKVERPKRQGNRPRADALMRVMQYVLIKTLADHFDISISKAEEQTSPKHLQLPNSCEIVAQAFSRAGKHTTYGQMRSLVYDDGAEHLRKLGNWAMS